MSNGIGQRLVSINNFIDTRARKKHFETYGESSQQFISKNKDEELEITLKEPLNVSQR